ncbi:hypothetical protein THAOC_19639 [Thalassiosira oceanica]|uniref:Uncharacterized protein n=1 Tax=Thalassiosira oceanica TaxID=159749 RepID=K0S1X0_THAOC|nr:hypothetical protein THAOC_19639 [Thalassiosira oceanica]|eukprot:EJK60073.1 hypothetical protein THAOC_19639 [Thalassiosira oceanica]
MTASHSAAAYMPVIGTVWSAAMVGRHLATGSPANNSDHPVHFDVLPRCGLGWWQSEGLLVRLQSGEFTGYEEAPSAAALSAPSADSMISRPRPHQSPETGATNRKSQYARGDVLIGDGSSTIDGWQAVAAVACHSAAATGSSSSSAALAPSCHKRLVFSSSPKPEAASANCIERARRVESNRDELLADDLIIGVSSPLTPDLPSNQAPRTPDLTSEHTRSSWACAGLKPAPELVTARCNPAHSRLKLFRSGDVMIGDGSSTIDGWQAVAAVACHSALEAQAEALAH